jgi:tripartite-type tricarboxylate transporter receptor subunit TctC
MIKIFRSNTGRGMALFFFSCVAVLFASAAPAQEYPAKPVQVIVSLPAGTGIDVLARTLSQGMDAKFGQRFLVVNRTGQGVMVAANALNTAQPDGYTIAFMPATLLTVQLLREKQPPYNRNTFVPICQTFDNVLFVTVAANSPFTDLQSMLAYAKANPGKLRYGTSGIASAPHLAGAELFQRAGVQVTDVPYAGETAYLPHILGGEIEMGMISAFLVGSQKGVRPLAVFAKERQKAHPNLPTTAELGHPISTLAYGGLFIRSDAPAAIISRLDAACREIVNSAAYGEMADKQAVRATYLDRRDFTARIDADYTNIGKLLESLKLKD